MNGQRKYGQRKECDRMGMVRLEGIRKTYLTSHGEVHALNGVDLTVEEGEFLAIMGRSGSGDYVKIRLS